MALSHRLVAPLSHRREHSAVNVLPHITQKAGLPHPAVYSNQDLHDRGITETSHIEVGQVRADLRGPSRGISVAADTACPHRGDHAFRRVAAGKAGCGRLSW